MASEQAPGTLIRVDNGRRDTWHHSVAFDGYRHETACGMAVDEVGEVEMDLSEWFDREEFRCDECAGSVRSLCPDSDRSGGADER